MQPTLALYRRYRPESFAEVIGQDHVTGPLRSALANNRVHHAYLFSGPRGCGKTTSARILARALNCEKAPVADPCGECPSCRDLARNGSGSIDVIEIDAASHGGVDDARDLRERAFFAPVSSRFKVYIIDEAHMVTQQGFNALLKLVEEPPEHLKFVFATTEPEKVLPTIRSRTHHYPFRLIPPRTLSDYLSRLCEQEGVSIDAAALPLVVRAGAGSARDTLSVLDQLIGGAGPDGVTYDVATGLLGYTPDTLLDEVVDAISAGDGATVFDVVDKVIETGQDPRRFTEDLLRRLRDLVILAAVPESAASGLLDAPEDAIERLSAQAARFGRSELVRAADLVAAGLTEMRGATAPRLLLELICARVLLPGADHGEEGLAARLDRVERRLNAGGMAPMSDREQTRAASRPREQPHAATETARTTTARTPAAVPEPDPTAEAPAPTAGPDPADTVVPEPPPEVPATPSAAADPPEAPAPEAPAADAAASSAADEPAAAGQLGQADLRRLWPEVLERVKKMKRFTWILLSQNAQVVGVDGTTLTLGFRNAGARDSFVNGGSDQILTQVLIDLVGAEWTVEPIVDQAADPAADSGTGHRVTKPAVPPEPAPADQAAAPDEGQEAAVVAGGAAAQEARAALRDGGGNADAGATSATQADPDAHAHRDDPDAEDDGLAGAALLERELGATVIEEIPHD